MLVAFKEVPRIALTDDTYRLQAALAPGNSLVQSL
jgi:hypothetical protein